MRRLPKTTTVPFAEELPSLLQQHGLSMSALASTIGVSRAHLHKIVHRTNYKTPSIELCVNVARHFGLPDDYFPEVRERAVIDRVRSDGAYRDMLYKAVKKMGGVVESPRLDRS